MSLTLITGVMNSGKTLIMTLYLFLEYIKGKEILTNYDLNFPHYKINRDWLEDFSKKGMALNNVAIGLDELWVWFDSRKSSSNTMATYFFLQSSKDDTPIYFTSQYNNQNDIRIRNNLHTIKECSRKLYNPYTDKFINIPEDKRFLHKELQKLLYIKVDSFQKSNVMGNTKLKKVSTDLIKAKPIFKLYDTSQKITPIQT